VSGVPLWARMSHLGTNVPADFLSRDLVADGDALVAAYLVRDGADPQAPYRVFVQKTDADGNALWIKGYDIEAAHCSILSVADGYVVSGQNSESNQYFTLKIDKNGTVVWANGLNYGPTSSLDATFSPPGQSAAIADSLYFTGASTAGLSDVLFWKTFADGSMQDTCAYVQGLVVTSSEVNMPISEPIDLKTFVTSAVNTPVNIVWASGSLQENMVCPNCTVPDPCPERNDFVAKLGPISCANGQIRLQLQICDLDGGELPPLSVSIYNANPFETAADRLEVFEYDGGGDSCTTLTLSNLVNLLGQNNVQNGLTLYAVVNDPGSGLTPFSPDDFPFSDLEECDYANNLDSLTIELPSAPTLSLGDDISICSNEEALLDAGPGFFRYQWSNGATTQTTTVSSAGQFRVTVTDFCGFRQFDTLELSVKPVPLVTENAAFCPGKSVTVRGFTFDQVGTFQRTIAGVGDDCDTIGTFFISQLPYEERVEVINFCPFQSVFINGVEYFDSGLVRDTVAASQGCDTVVFYFLNQLPLPFRTFHFDICPGGSVTFNGVVYTQPTSFVDTLYSTGFGCDTIAYVSIDLLPAPTRNETLSFCPGETVVVNGQTYDQPGTVQYTVPGISGECDTLVTVTLQYEAPSPSTAAIACPPSATIAVVPGSGAATFSYALPTATSDCNCPGVDVSLQSGIASGGLFPIGTTQVCYRAQDYCGAGTTCCFNVTVTEEQACDVKSAGCVRFELLRITESPSKEKTYRVRVTNNCTSKMVFAAIQIPTGMAAVEPANFSTYTSPDGRSYSVRNPNYSPFYSIRFKSATDSIVGGQSDVFEYTLPAQAQVTFINIAARLANQTLVEAKLNTFNCPVQNTMLEERDDDRSAFAAAKEGGLLLFPNPTRGELYADLSAWSGQNVQVRILDGRGALVQQHRVPANEEAQALPLSAGLPSGLYFVEVRTEAGEREVGRFVLER
jgi:hypothetical protein